MKDCCATQPIILFKKKFLVGLRRKVHILRATKWRKFNWIGHVLCRNSLLKHITDEKIERTRKGERIKRLQECLKEAKIYRNMREETPDRNRLENTLC
jgi:hypothetical protein